MVEHIVHTLLRRYGVVFWRLLQREAAWLPSWREMLRVLRRLEARRAPLSGTLVAISGADPLNLAGVIVPGAKVPALTNNRVLYRDGAAIAAVVSGDIQWYEQLEPGEARVAEDALIKRRIGSPLLAYLR